ncbi:MAG: amidase family protein [Leptolyngbyaceae cyanobacterium bins.59]|nr:amidase family protein [Leptolyngbyaceae cyanobacterium bins.59]
MSTIAKKIAVGVAAPATFLFLPLAAQAASFTLEDATVASINQAFNAGVISSEQLVQLYLNRIAAYDDQGPALNSIITVNPNALAEAAALDLERRTTGARSPLHGIPVILKDNFNTVGLPTTAGATLFKDFIPQQDAFQVQKLREAGAIILAKANLSEFAFSGGSSESSLGGITRNAYDPLRTPAGSSGGTATAIAANFGVIGLGTDTGGSIRNPSAVSNLVGLRPTIGLSSRSGIVPLALSQDVGGPMTRTIMDLAYALDATVGFDLNDPVTAASIGKIPATYTSFLDVNGLQGSKIGVVRSLFGPNTDPEAARVNQVIEQALTALKQLGAEVVDTTIPNLSAILASPSLSAFEFKSDLNNYLAQNPNAPVDSLAEIIQSGGFLPSNRSTLIARNNVAPLETNATYQQIIRDRPGSTQESILQALKRLDADPLNDLDALIYPTITRPAGLITTGSNFGSNNRLSAFSGFPALTVPAGFTSDNRAVGLEFLGTAFSEPTLLRLTYAYEQGTQNRRPSTIVPPLKGETIPESGQTAGLMVVGLMLLGWKFKKQRPNPANGVPIVSARRVSVESFS